MSEINDGFKVKLQLWGTVLTTLVTFGTIGYTLVSETHSIRNEISIIRERQNTNTEAITKFIAPGARFTAQDGNKLHSDIEKTAERVRLLENKVIVLEDRAGRRQ
jgi:hypothetical protein